MNANDRQHKIQLPAGKVYIVTKRTCPMIGSEELKVINVRPEHEAEFQKEYAGRILISADSIQEAFMKFNEYKNGEGQ